MLCNTWKPVSVSALCWLPSVDRRLLFDWRRGRPCCDPSLRWRGRAAVPSRAPALPSLGPVTLLLPWLALPCDPRRPMVRMAWKTPQLPFPPPLSPPPLPPLLPFSPPLIRASPPPSTWTTAGWLAVPLMVLNTGITGLASERSSSSRMSDTARLSFDRFDLVDAFPDPAPDES